jgi:flagellar P-ring protein precursor FlgI
MGNHVQIGAVAIAHGNLNITIRTENQVSQPNALAQGRTAEVTNSDITVTEDEGQLKVVKESVSLGDVVKALNNLGATPRDLIAIFQAMQQAGAIRAELIIM